MAIQKRENKINLLLQKGLESTTTGRVLSWVLSTFRIIVILTEIIVMIAFLSRFWLDAKNTDLSEEIEQRQTILAESLNFEDSFKQTQAQLKIFSELATDKDYIADSLKTIASNLPPDLFLTSFSLTEKDITIKGITPNEKSIQQLIVNLETNDVFNNVKLAEIGTSENNSALLLFTIKLSLENNIKQKT